MPMTDVTPDRIPTLPGFIRGFRDHPASVGESYFGHLVYALRFSSRLFAAALAALVHAIVPPLCETTASRILGDLHEEIALRHAGDH